jgi:hypothetical protein
MPKPSFRFFILPLGAICTLILLASQTSPSSAQRDTAVSQVRQQVVDCSSKSPAEVCVISFDGDSDAL